MVPIIEHRDAGEMADALADLVASDLEAALRAGPATLAVPGGSTPKAFLAALGARDLDWSSITTMATDERWTSPADPRSNEAMIRAALGDVTFLGFWREGETPDSAAPGVSAAVEARLPLASVILGMGADMHCASLFPGGDGLTAAMAADAPAVAAVRPAGGLEPRLTLSARVLTGAGRIRLLINGAEKRKALEAALGDPDPATAPVGAVLTNANDVEVHWAL